MALRLLVIEGDQGILDVMDQVVLSERHEIITAKNSGILNDLDKIQPDIIFLDEWIHYESGIELCKQLKANSKTSFIPVVLLSAMISIAQQSVMAGADSFIRKPFDLRELTEIINRYQ